jgi:hypothetical protein
MPIPRTLFFGSERQRGFRGAGMNEVAPQVLWLEGDEWLDGQKQEAHALGRREGLPMVAAVPPFTERRAAAAGRARVELTGYARLALLIVLLAEIAWCGYLVSLAISLL